MQLLFESGDYSRVATIQEWRLFMGDVYSKKYGNYSVAYFECITKFTELYHRTSVKGEVHMHFVDT